MVFSSVTFLFCFLPAVLTLHAIPGWRWRMSLLLVANLLFYSWGEGSYALVILASILANWLFGLFVRPATAGRDPIPGRRLFFAGIAFNLGLLFVFKYAGFAVASLNRALAALALPSALPVPAIHLPIGISFFTFQALSYLVDVRRGAVPASRSLLDFAVYKSLFPQLIAGPIVRYRDVAAQFSPHRIPPEQYAAGIRRFIVGLGKKVLVANTVAEAADRIFALPPATLGPAAAWLGLVCLHVPDLLRFLRVFGHGDRPRPDAGIHVPRELRLSLPLLVGDASSGGAGTSRSRRGSGTTCTSRSGGTAAGDLRTAANLMLVFLLCGLWHGAAWTFVAWGA